MSQKKYRDPLLRHGAPLLDCDACMAQWDRFRQIVETAEEGIITIDGQARIDFVNSKMSRMLGYASREMLGRPLADFMDDEGRRILEFNLERRQQGIAEQFDFRFVRKDGSDLWVNTSTNPLTDASGAYVGALGMFTDLTERRQAQRLLAWEKSALESIASAASMQELLDQLVLGLEEHLSGGICSILLVDEDGLHLRHGSAPNLPASYNDLVDGLAISPTSGSSGTAVSTGQQVVVSEISRDPLWANYREIALQYGLQACWSTPIQDKQGRILGTFAVYYRESRSPNSWELDTVGRAVHIAYLTIERKQAEENLRRINQELESRVAARTAQLRALACQLTQTEERERLRVADSLHEGLLQLLATVAMGLDGLREHLSESAAQGCLEELRGCLRQAIDLGRDLTYEIYPPALHHQDFGYALECLGKRYQHVHGLDVNVVVPSAVDLPVKELRIFLFRAAKELLLNVHRHAHEGQAQLVLSLDSDQDVCLRVSDHGKGFDPAAARAQEGVVGGFGLFSLRERVESLGGTLQVDSAPGQGTCVTVRLPLGV